MVYQGGGGEGDVEKARLLRPRHKNCSGGKLGYQAESETGLQLLPCPAPLAADVI